MDSPAGFTHNCIICVQSIQSLCKATGFPKYAAVLSPAQSMAAGYNTQRATFLWLFTPSKTDVDSQTGTSSRPQYWFQTFPFRQFHVLFNSLFKVLFIFPSRYLFAIGLSPVFSLRWNLPPALGCIPKQPDSSTAPRGENELKPTGLSPSLASHSKELGLRPPQRALL